MISIVIPVYNAEQFLTQMLDSVLRQSYADYEVILVNDGSKDGSSAICHDYAGRYGCVRVFDRDNCGAAASRNFGLQQAKGEFVWFMDSDDLLSEDALSAAVSAQEKYGADVVIGGMNFCFDDGRTEPKAVERDLVFAASQLPQYYTELFRKNYLSSLWNKLIRRDVITQIGLQMDESLHLYEDYVFCMDLLLKSGTVVCLPQIFYEYQLRGMQSLSRRYKQNITEMFCRLKEKITGYREAFSEENQQACDSLSNLMIYIAYECVKNEARCKEQPLKKMRKLLRETEFCEAMQTFTASQCSKRGVQLLMKAKAALILFMYFRLSGKAGK